MGGWVYALRASDGVLAWRFLAAPQDRQVGVFNQLESVWPVHGAVLVQNETLYVAAGRSTYLDGGIVLYRIDPITGKELSHEVVSFIDPETDRQTGKEDKKIYGNDMEGTTTDILCGDGESVFMKHLHFNREGKRTEELKPHLLSVTGLLIDDWFVRTYWLLDSEISGGWGAWATAAGRSPSGRILSFDAKQVYGYGRPNPQNGRVGHRANQYVLFREENPIADATSGSHTPAASNAAEEAGPWSKEISLVVRAMVLANDKLVIAGPPDVAEKSEGILSYLNEENALASRRGDKGSLLQIVSAENGELLAGYELDCTPIFDGLATAGGRLYLSTQEGRVVCYGENRPRHDLPK